MPDSQAKTQLLGRFYCSTGGFSLYALLVVTDKDGIAICLLLNTTAQEPLVAFSTIMLVFVLPLTTMMLLVSVIQPLQFNYQIQQITV